MENRLSEVSAEMWLNYFYPDLMEKWIAVHSGTFWRNYSNDAMKVNPESANVSIARDGMQKRLPQGFITYDDELKGRDAVGAHKSLERRKKIQSDAFLPFDSFAFRRKMRLERIVSEILDSKEDFIFSQFFGIDIKNIENKYVADAVRILPFVKDLRGDYSFVRNLLSLLLCCQVTVRIGKYSDTDTTLCHVPRIVFRAVIPGLNRESYLEKRREIKPLEDFVREWLIPAEAECEIEICADGISLVQETTLLNYNAKVN